MRPAFRQSSAKPWQDLRVRHTLAGRPETLTQAKVLKTLRDDGPLSRVELADRLGVSRTTMASEVARLAELGLAEAAGPAASRGGRRSTLVDLSSEVRFVGIAIGATAMSVAVTDGRLTVLGQRYVDMDVRLGPGARAGHVPGADPQGAGRAGRGPPVRRGHRCSRSGGLSRRNAGLAADHAWLGRVSGARRDRQSSDVRHYSTTMST